MRSSKALGMIVKANDTQRGQMWLFLPWTMWLSHMDWGSRERLIPGKVEGMLADGAKESSSFPQSLSFLCLSGWKTQEWILHISLQNKSGWWKSILPPFYFVKKLSFLINLADLTVWIHDTIISGTGYCNTRGSPWGKRRSPSWCKLATVHWVMIRFCVKCKTQALALKLLQVSEGPSLLEENLLSLLRLTQGSLLTNPPFLPGIC